jgi:hypothetical protein
MLNRSGDDHLEHARAIAQHVMIPEAQNAITFRYEPTIALNVACILSVLATIDLDDQPLLLTNEVDNVAADWHLPPEAQSVEAMCPQHEPEASLGVRHVAAQRFGAGAMDWRNRSM